MKKMLLMVILSMLCYSVNGAQDSIETQFFNEVQDSLFEVPGAMDKLKTFVKNNRAFVESNGKSLVEGFGEHLDNRIFTALDTMVQIVLPGYVFKKDTTQQKSIDEGVVDFFRQYLFVRGGDPILLRFIEYAYKKRPVYLDEYTLTPDTNISVGQEIDKHIAHKDKSVIDLVERVNPKRHDPGYLERFMKLVDACLVEKENVQALKDFVAGHSGAALLSTQRQGLPISLEEFFEYLSPAIFPLRDSVVKAINPAHKIAKNPMTDLPPAAILNMALQQYILSKDGMLPIELLQYAYTKFPLCVDDYFIDDAEDVEDSKHARRTLGMAIDEAQENNEPWVKGLFEMVKPNRLDKKQFFALLDDCLIEKVSLRELHKFIHMHNGSALLMQVRQEDGKVTAAAQYLLGKNPVIFKKRNDIMKSFDPQYTPESGDALFLENLQLRAQQEVVEVIRRYLESKGKANGEFVKYMYKQVPLSLDAFRFNEGSSLGQELDRVKETPYGKELSLLVQKKRWTRPGTEPDRIAFGNLLLASLIDLNTDREDQLRYYGADPILRTAELPGILLGNSGVGFTLDQKVRKVDDFFELLNPVLFPQKENVRKCLSLRVKAGGEHTQKSDKEFIEALVRTSLTNKELRPFLKYAFQNYEKHYGIPVDQAQNINLGALTYGGESVKSYLAKQSSMVDKDYFENLFYRNGEEKGASDDERTRNKGSVALWRKVLGVGIVGAALYACYKYFPSKKGGVAAKIAPAAAV